MSEHRPPSIPHGKALQRATCRRRALLSLPRLARLGCRTRGDRVQRTPVRTAHAPAASRRPLARFPFPAPAVFEHPGEVVAAGEYFPRCRLARKAVGQCLVFHETGPSRRHEQAEVSARDGLTTVARSLIELGGPALISWEPPAAMLVEAPQVFARQQVFRVATITEEHQGRGFASVLTPSAIAHHLSEKRAASHHATIARALERCRSEVIVTNHANAAVARQPPDIGAGSAGTGVAGPSIETKGAGEPTWFPSLEAAREAHTARQVTTVARVFARPGVDCAGGAGLGFRIGPEPQACANAHARDNDESHDHG